MTGAFTGSDRAAHSRHRLDELLAANRSIVSDLTLPVVLRRIVEAACRLTGARYGALGVLAPGGRSLDQFLTVGVEDATAARIGPLPTGKGLLGAVIDDPFPIRLDRMADDARSVGFPEHHPPMASFLGVPVRVRNVVFGNLYLAEAPGGAFTAHDEQVVTGLAATAGVAIENARLFARAEQRQQWLEASAVITRQLLADVGEDPLAVIARRARDVADADLVTVVLPTTDGHALLVEVAAGPVGDDLAGYTYPRGGSLVGDVLDSGRPLSLPDATVSLQPWHQSAVLTVGPIMVLPLAGATGPRGALAVGRVKAREPFDDDDLEMASAFANQAALALELADARAHQLRVQVLEDRDRIARDLHDHVIQRLFAIGLTVESALARLDAAGESEVPEVVGRLSRVVSDLDTTVAQIRTAVFELRGPTGGGRSTRRQMLDVVAEVTPLLPAEPAVRFTGPVDAVIGDGALTDLLATVRESLSNVARHAHAHHVTITLSADSAHAVLVVEDDGVGVGATTRRSGLDNLRVRAENRRGSLELAAVDATSGRGTRLTWSIDLD